ncbi:MAG TPA: hypothetical protein ENN23_01355, partial [Deltaproteobacteria bacterium]|nr:hypothetical protein [Deltaproteobacteria bacterium]
MRHRILKALAFVVLFFFIWTSGGLFGLCNIAYAAMRDNQKQSAHRKQEQRPEEKFQQAVEDIKTIIHDKLADNEKRGRLKAKINEIESFDSEIKSQFAATEKRLRQAGLPQEILQRHYNFVKHYEDNLKELRTNLDAADKTKTKEEFSARMQKVKTHLEKVAPPRRHKPLDPNKLPHRISDIKRKEPRTKPSEFLKDIKQTASSSLRATAGSAAISAAVIPMDNTVEAASFRSEARNLDFLTKDSSPRYNGIRNDSNNVIPANTGIQTSSSLRATAGSAAISAAVIPMDNTVEAASYRSEARNLDFSTKDSSPRYNGIRNDNNNVIPQPDWGIQTSAVTPAHAGVQTAAVIPRLEDRRMPVDRGIQKTLTNNKPILLASNDSWASHLESLPKFEKDITSTNPPFLKGDIGGFSNTTTEPIILAQAGNLPTNADLAETIDVQLTPAIRAKAAELNH